MKGILLASGSGVRFGSQKLLHRLPSGEFLGTRSAKNLSAALPDSIAVVREQDTSLTDTLIELGYQIVVNPEPEAGMGGSLARAIRATSDAPGWIVALADMPWICPATIEQVVQKLKSGSSIVAPVYQDQRGHPVGFGPQWGAELSRLSGDQGARNILHRYAEQLELIKVDDAGVICDVDHPSDLNPAQ